MAQLDKTVREVQAVRQDIITVDAMGVLAVPVEQEEAEATEDADKMGQTVWRLPFQPVEALPLQVRQPQFRMHIQLV